jgi:hypothetical protein
VDCYKHRPLDLVLDAEAPSEPAYHDSTLDSDVMSNNDETSEQATLPEPQEASEKDLESSAPHTRRTSKQRDPQNRATLVTEPVVVDKP